MTDTTPVLVVIHEAPDPAVDGMIAAALAAAWGDALGAPPDLLRLGPADAPVPPAGEVEHATADGALVANGLLWAERALSRPLTAAADAGLGTVPPPAEPTVIALDPARFPGLSRAALERAVSALAPAADWIAVHGAGGTFGAVARRPDGTQRVGRWNRDRYGRPVTREGPCLTGRFAAFPPASIDPSVPGPRLVVIGEAAHHRAVGPAVLAAIGDAADSLGLASTIEFVSPRGLGADAMATLAAGADGLILSGGSDLGQVAGQIAAASAALDGRTPILGIGLGMQSMTVAVARDRAGLTGAGLEEEEPHARPLIFERLRDADGAVCHRLGDRSIRLAEGSRFARIYGTGHTVERVNHRFALAPDMLPALAAAGLEPSATAEYGTVVDGIEVAAHPFFLGLQGHPELTSRPGRPHPLFVGLIRAASAARS